MTEEDQESPVDEDHEEYLSEDDHQSSIRGFVVGIIVGVVAGASAAILFAPARGRVIRRRIGRTARKAGRDASVRLEVWRRDAERRKQGRARDHEEDE